jgi:hypothetical protein
LLPSQVVEGEKEMMKTLWWILRDKCFQNGFSWGLIICGLALYSGKVGIIMIVLGLGGAVATHEGGNPFSEDFHR